MVDGGGVLGFIIWGGLLCGSSVHGSLMVVLVDYFVVFVGGDLVGRGIVDVGVCGLWDVLAFMRGERV